MYSISIDIERQLWNIIEDVHNLHNEKAEKSAFKFFREFNVYITENGGHIAYATSNFVSVKTNILLLKLHNHLKFEPKMR